MEKDKGGIMKEKSRVSSQLYEIMLQRGYPEEFCDLITQNLNTDFTAQRMIDIYIITSIRRQRKSQMK